MGYLHSRGLGVALDWAQAKAFYRQAAEAAEAEGGKKGGSKGWLPAKMATLSVRSAPLCFMFITPVHVF